MAKKIIQAPHPWQHHVICQPLCFGTHIWHFKGDQSNQDPQWCLASHAMSWVELAPMEIESFGFWLIVFPYGLSLMVIYYVDPIFGGNNALIILPLFFKHRGHWFVSATPGEKWVFGGTSIGKKSPEKWAFIPWKRDPCLKGNELHLNQPVNFQEKCVSFPGGKYICEDRCLIGYIFNRDIYIFFFQVIYIYT